MKKTKTIKAIALALLCTLLVGAAVGIGISATESAQSDGTDVATIGMKNLAYNDKLNLAIQLTNAMDSGELGLAVWVVNTEGNYTASNWHHVDYNIYTDVVDSQTIYYAFSQGIAAKDIDTEYVFGAVVKDSDGAIHIGQQITYSVSDYLNDRLSDTTISAQQKTLYEAVIAYGDAASGVFKSE